MSLHGYTQSSSRKQAMLWYDYYFHDPNDRNIQAVQTCKWYGDLSSCTMVKRLGADMSRGDSDPKDVDTALVCFVMNDNQFPANLEKRVYRQLNGKVIENDPLAKGSNQWGVDLYNELQWLDDEKKQDDFVLLKEYVKPKGTRGPLPAIESDRPEDGGDKHAGARPKRVRSMARRISSTSVESEIDGDGDYESDGYANEPNEASRMASSRRERLRSSKRRPRPTTQSPQNAYASVISSEASSIPDSEKHQGLQHQSNPSRATIPLDPHSDGNIHGDAAYDMSIANTDGVQRWHAEKRTRSPRADSQNSDKHVDKRSKSSSAASAHFPSAGQTLTGTSSPRPTVSGPSRGDWTIRPGRRSRGPENLSPDRRPATPASPEAPSQRFNRLAPTYGRLSDVTSPDEDANGRHLTDRYKKQMLRYRIGKDVQTGVTSERQGHLARGDTHAAGPDGSAVATGDYAIGDDEQGDMAKDLRIQGKQSEANKEIKTLLEEVMNERLSTHKRDLEIQLQLSLDTMEDNIVSKMIRAMGDTMAGTIGSGTQVPKPGSKLPNGVLVWDVRLLTTAWDPKDFGGFLSAAKQEKWHEDTRAWMLQEKYFVDLALAHPCGPEALAKLAIAWQLTELSVDLEHDLPVVVAEKVYVSTVAGTFGRGQMDDFLRSIGEG